MDIGQMHRRLEQHARQEALLFNTRDTQVLRAALNLWAQFCVSAVTSLLTICGLLVSIRPFQAGVQWYIRLFIEAKYAVCRLAYSKDLAVLKPFFADEGLQASIQSQTRDILTPFIDMYSETLQAYLEDKGMSE